MEQAADAAKERQLANTIVKHNKMVYRFIPVRTDVPSCADAIY